jgi:ketosteroid isomerase-like protein
MTNTEIVKGIYTAFGRGDVASVINALSDEVEWVTPGSSVIPYAGHYRGRAAVTRFFEKLAESTELDPFMPQQYVEQGDTVVALGSYTGRAKASQTAFKTSWSMVFKLSGGKVTSFQEYIDTGALEAAFGAPAKAARG